MTLAGGRRPRVVALLLGLVAVAVAVVVGLTSPWSVVPEGLPGVAGERTAERADPGDPCVGPGALVDDNDCGSIQGDGPLLAPPDAVKAQLKDRLLQRCQASIAGTELRQCIIGEVADPRETVALVGDSHAISLLRAADELGKRRGWRVVVHGKGSCPSTDAHRTLAGETGPARSDACRAYNTAVDRALLGDPAVTRVIATSYTSRYGWLPFAGATGTAAGQKGFAARFDRWRDAGKEVVVIADVPSPRKGLSAPACVAANPAPSDACTMPRAEAVGEDLAVTAARSLGLRVVDLTDLFCDSTTCYARVGDTIVYRDTDHLSFEYARLLAPFIDQRLG